MEEEEEDGRPPPTAQKRPIGFVHREEPSEDVEKRPQPSRIHEAYGDFLRALAEERGTIINSEKLTAKEKQVLLDENRKTLVVASGGSVRKTDSVVYGILIFGGAVLVILSLLTCFAGLPSDVTLAFVGTVLGGTIATIAQKLGKL
jgi:hypothetical protein